MIILCAMILGLNGNRNYYDKNSRPLTLDYNAAEDETAAKEWKIKHEQ